MTDQSERELDVNAVVKVERSMPAEDRMTRLESDVGTLKADVVTLKADVGILKADVVTLKADVGILKADVGELKGDVKSLNARVSEWIIASAKESGNLRAEMERGFGAVRTEIEKNRADTEKGFGTLKASIESAKLWMLVTGVGSVILVTLVTFLGRALKLF